MILVKCPHCIGEERASENTDHVEKLLPPMYSHLMCQHELLETSLDAENFRVGLRLQLTTEEQVLKWLDDFQKSSALTWRKSRTYPDSGRYNKYRVDLRCHHKTYTSSRPPKTTTKIIKASKNTNCPATMFIILKRLMVERKSRSGDPHIEDGYFLHVNLRNEHNHKLASPEVMRWRDVSNETIEKLHELFKSGHSPSSALKIIKYNLQEEEGENYIYAIADRSICPDLQFCYRLYHKLYQNSLAAPAAEEVTTAVDNICVFLGACSEKDISEQLFKPLELGTQLETQSWETTTMIISVCEGAGEEVVGSLDGQLEEIFGKLKKKLSEDATFTPPIRAFVSNFFQMKTDSVLQSALFSFGKTTETTTNQMTLQPPAGPRRKVILGARRSVSRPPKNLRREHPYCNSRSVDTTQTLTFCLQQSSTLEKTDEVLIPCSPPQ
ncbi:hypothetical protein E1301_Tti019626 [Triplophysa tibetana]|uniref:Uncharacterized protein n=1 Tax=Triplophysa tibetana TaxID=1572043 RepID=A0A5A9NVG1_9TELE|nr:hypothetical protein E1301_Tti019626 [Triplophysa tibetana]